MSQPTAGSAPPGRPLEPAWFAEVEGELRLMGMRCRDCGKVFFPAKPICPACAGEELSAVPLSRRGTLHTFARSVLGPPGIERPFVMGFIDLPEGIKLYSLITHCEPWEEVLAAGMEMELCLDRIATGGDGEPVWSYTFRPARGRAGRVEEAAP